MHCAGAKPIDDAAQADIVMQFDDSTLCDPQLPDLSRRVRRMRTVNFNCRDISKSNVAIGVRARRRLFARGRSGNL